MTRLATPGDHFTFLGAFNNVALPHICGSLQSFICCSQLQAFTCSCEAYCGCLQCLTPGAGSFCVTVKVQWDIYTCEGMQTYQYNQFRVVGCDSLDGFQQWCKEAVSAAAELATDERALHQCAPLLASNASAHNTEALRLSQENSSPLALGSKRSRVALDTSPSSGSSSSSVITSELCELQLVCYSCHTDPSTPFTGLHRTSCAVGTEG